MNRSNKLGLFALLLAIAAPFAHAVDVTPDEVVTAVTANVDKVGVIGGKTYMIAGGLALAGVVIGFIRKAKR